MCARCMAGPAVYSRRDAGMESLVMNRRTYLLHALMLVLMIHSPPSLLGFGWEVPDHGRGNVA